MRVSLYRTYAIEILISIIILILSLTNLLWAGGLQNKCTGIEIINEEDHTVMVPLGKDNGINIDMDFAVHTSNNTLVHVYPYKLYSNMFWSQSLSDEEYNLIKKGNNISDISINKEMHDAMRIEVNSCSIRVDKLGIIDGENKLITKWMTRNNCEVWSSQYKQSLINNNVDGLCVFGKTKYLWKIEENAKKAREEERLSRKSSLLEDKNKLSAERPSLSQTNRGDSKYLGPKLNMMSCSNPRSMGNRWNEMACYGIWDYGDAFGNDENMCASSKDSAYSDPGTGCIISTIACKSGKAIAKRMIKISNASNSEMSIIANNLKTSNEIIKNELIIVWEYYCN